MRNLITLFILIIFSSASAQVGPKMLLLDPNVELECTEAVNDMYNFNFERAEKQFQILKIKYPDHPLPYFLMGLSTWWKIMPNVDTKTYDDTFIAYMDTSISKAEKLYDEESTKIEAAFFLSGANGFKAELYGERKSYTKATFSGRNALKYLMDYKDNNDLSPEFLFGLGLYNYYEVWIKEEYPLLKPILFFFPNGDKQVGLKQLQEVSENAFYARTEAQIRLIKILTDDEDNKEYQALPLAKYLYDNYPNNPYFERSYAKVLYYTSNFRELEPVCLDLLKKIDEKQLGYEEISGRYASYFLGILNRNRNQEVAKQYFLKAVDFAEKLNAHTGYYLYSLNNLAQIAEKEGKHELAREYYKRIKKDATNDEEAYRELKREAKKNLKTKKNTTSPK